MGTNYFTYADSTCNNPAHTERLHIGKSSAGWEFGFQGYPDKGLTSWRAWREFLSDDGHGHPRYIEDESCQTLTLERLTEIVDRVGYKPPDLSREPTHRYAHSESYSGCEGKGGFICHVKSEERNHPDLSQRSYHDPEGYDFTNSEFS